MDFYEVKMASTGKEKTFFMSHLYVSSIQSVAVLMSHQEIQDCPDHLSGLFMTHQLVATGFFSQEGSPVNQQNPGVNHLQHYG